MTFQSLVMADNRPACAAVAPVDPKIVRAQKRVLRLYKRLRRKGGWRAVQFTIGSANVSYVYDFAVHGVVPADLHEREVLLHWRATPADALTAYLLGTEVRILAILEEHHGELQKIHGPDLKAELARLGHVVRERPMRAAIHELRRRGKLICSLAGKDGGYWLAASMAEFEKFEILELGAKIADMEETRQAMRKAARRQFSADVPAEQLELRQ